MVVKDRVGEVSWPDCNAGRVLAVDTSSRILTFNPFTNVACVSACACVCMCACVRVCACVCVCVFCFPLVALVGGRRSLRMSAGRLRAFLLGCRRQRANMSRHGSIWKRRERQTKRRLWSLRSSFSAHAR